MQAEAQERDPVVAEVSSMFHPDPHCPTLTRTVVIDCFCRWMCSSPRPSALLCTCCRFDRLTQPHQPWPPAIPYSVLVVMHVLS